MSHALIGKLIPVLSIALIFIIAWTLFTKGPIALLLPALIVFIVGLHYRKHRYENLNPGTLPATTTYGILSGAALILLAILAPELSNLFWCLVIGGWSIGYSIYLRKKYLIA